MDGGPSGRVDGSDPLPDTAEASSPVRCEPGSARAAIANAIGTSVEQLSAELPRARAGEDPEGVHQARVATRRLRSDLRTFAPLLDDAWRAETRAELELLADALGAVRDNDVLEVRLVGELGAAGVEPEAAARLLAVLDQQGSVARQALVDVLDDARTSSLLSELRRAATDPPTTRAARGRAERRLRPLVRKPWRKLVRTVDALGADPTAVELHRVRLLAKRVRYAGEAVVPVFGRDARRFAVEVKQMQEVLGDMNDAEVAMAWLARTASDLEPDDAFTAGQLAHHFRDIADAHRHGWERPYRRARKRSGWFA